jgi:hypothetical protein
VRDTCRIATRSEFHCGDTTEIFIVFVVLTAVVMRGLILRYEAVTLANCMAVYHRTLHRLFLYEVVSITAIMKCPLLLRRQTNELSKY